MPFFKTLSCNIYLISKHLFILGHIKKQFCRTFYMDKSKHLAAFDFDKTIAIENTDHVVQDLLPKDVVPKYVRNGWTSYMQNVFELLHGIGVEKSAIQETICHIAPIPGMCELIKELSENLNFDIIIISDSNSYFINTWLNEQKLADNIKQVFTNPAQFVNGLLKVEKYHIQDWCSLSEKNLCKGSVLDDFIESQKDRGTTYGKVVYVGDGQNDFCPMLRLNYGDLACCREGFKCAELISYAKANKPVQNQLYEVKADVCIWNNGFDVLNAVRAIIQE